MPAPTGAHTELWYTWEDPTDLGAPVDYDAEDEKRKPFGGNASPTTKEGSNAAIDVFEPNNRERAQIIAEMFDGSFSVDFEITNPYWLAAVISHPYTVDDGNGVYTHIYEDDVPLPMTVYIGYEDRAARSDGQLYQVLEGVFVESATIDTSTGSEASCSLSAAYVNERFENDPLEGQPQLEYDAMTFAEAMLSLDGETLSLVQDASVEINNNTDPIYELGTRKAVDYSPKAREPSVNYTQIHIETDETREMYGNEAADAVQDTVEAEKPMEFVLDNGKSGEEINRIEFLMDGAFPESVSLDNIGNPQEDLQQSINRRLRTVEAVAENGEDEAW